MVQARTRLLRREASRLRPVEMINSNCAVCAGYGRQLPVAVQIEARALDWRSAVVGVAVALQQAEPGTLDRYPRADRRHRCGFRLRGWAARLQS